MGNTSENHPGNEQKERAWPYGIIVAYIIFVTATLGFVAFTFTVKFDLVVPDYYQQTLVYQDQIDRESNAMALEQPIRWNIDEGQLMVYVPQELLSDSISGKIKMYRPSDASLDKVYDLVPDASGVQSIALIDLATGQWKLHVLIETSEKEYFSQFSVFIR